jgi:hypothetical protein
MAWYWLSVGGSAQPRGERRRDASEATYRRSRLRVAFAGLTVPAPGPHGDSSECSSSLGVKQVISASHKSVSSTDADTGARAELDRNMAELLRSCGLSLQACPRCFNHSYLRRSP